MNVLSLFDGMSCGQIALDQLGIHVDTYFAAEIDKYAIQVAKVNYPDMIHLGDVREVQPEGLPQIDLLIGGSPCQGFSFAGKQLNFDDPRSQLFFEYVRLLKALKPKYFLLENVKMKKESEQVITDMLGVEPIEINSNLVSAQNRKRLYWTNIPMDGLPEDRGIVLADILEDGATDRQKSHCIDANYWKGGNLKSYFKKNRRQLVFDGEVKGARIVNRRLDENGKRKDNDKSIPLQAQLELRLDDKAGCLTTVQKDSVVAYPLILQKARGYNKGGLKAKDGKTPTVSTSAWEHNNHLTMDEGITWRKLTPTEVERLQTVPDGYTDHVSNTQRYKMLGNGWTVEVIKHILKGIKA